MGRGVHVILLLAVLSACGGTGVPPGFLNQTRHSTSELWAAWKLARQSVTQKVDLNPLERSLYGAAPMILPGDQRALQITPQQLLVAPEPDVSSDTLLTDTGTYRADPTGMIACPQPCNVRYAPAYSRYQTPAVRYAASWEFQGNNFAQIMAYEFESQILYQLGYDVKWR